jgi:23S rRNA (adenine2503-C2)-methyltransferase
MPAIVAMKSLDSDLETHIRTSETLEGPSGLPGRCVYPFSMADPRPLAGAAAPGAETDPVGTHLSGLLPEDLVALLDANGISANLGEARRILAHAVASGREGFPSRRPVRQALCDAVERLVDRRPLVTVETATDPADGFHKHLFQLDDGRHVEAVRIPLAAPDRFSVCLSSQVGCAMACEFCATGRLGFSRNLEAWEMVEQFLAIRREAPGRVTGAVFQGQGEPLQNYDAVMQAADILSHPCGGRIAARAISVSTVGLVPAIHRLARERRRLRLIVSLTSAVDERRSELLPKAAAWSVADVAEAVRAYQREIGGRVTVAWVVLGGVNTGDDEIRALARHFDGVPLRFNLIDVNDPRPDGFRRATDEELGDFRDRLRRLGIPVVRRYSGGSDANAACGMLAATRSEKDASGPVCAEV